MVDFLKKLFLCFGFVLLLLLNLGELENFKLAEEASLNNNSASYQLFSIVMIYTVNHSGGCLPCRRAGSLDN